MEKHRNFTLIELLIVIAIIAILAAMLLPALNAARDKANSAYCVNQQKQLGAAMMQYSDDHEGYWPIRATTRPPEYLADGSTVNWPWLLVYGRYVNGKGFLCPAGQRKIDSDWARGKIVAWAKAHEASQLKTTNNTPYGYPFYGRNTFLDWSADSAFPKVSMLRKSSSTVLLGDSEDYGNKIAAVPRYVGSAALHFQYSSAVGIPAAVHRDSINITFCDSHVENFRIPTGTDIYTVLPKRIFSNNP